jgi:hypothetical protein
LPHSRLVERKKTTNDKPFITVNNTKKTALEIRKKRGGEATEKEREVRYWKRNSATKKGNPKKLYISIANS